MTDKSIVGYKGKVQEAGDFGNQNEGKVPLNDQDEYILRLKDIPRIKIMTVQKDHKDGTTSTESVDKAICVFEEQTTKNIVMAFFKVDALNFAEEESYQSAILKFFRKIGHPVPDNTYPDWSEYFVPGMRFRSRVVVKPDSKYYVDVPTVRKLLPTDINPVKTEAERLANAHIVVKGCVNSQDAFMRLLDAKVDSECISAFVAADKAGKITYPC